ncbi:MAG TPA: vitamin K epoxide reductase family protein [Candidatus Saccharimonadales bacterium]|nr:vitamin K epoxide reductase family protein [Candidatus Saccharimonadales bacterium]
MARHTKTDSARRLAPVIPYLLVIGGLIGIVCSLILVRDQIKIWEDPSYVPACSLNPLVNCGTVINSKQGEVFGVPAPFFGLLVFPVLVTVGIGMLAGAQFKRWFWRLTEAGMLGGVAFALWLFFLSVYRAKALCPFCLTVDVVVYTLAWYITLYVVREGHIPVPRRLIGVADFARRFHLEILITWFIILVAFILHHFWYYYGQFL